MSGFSGDDPSGPGVPPLILDWKAGQTFYGYDEMGKACRFPRPPPMQRAVVTTLSAAGTGAQAGVLVGQIKWFFPNKFPAGVVPVVLTNITALNGARLAVRAIDKTNEYAVLEVTRPIILLTALSDERVGGVQIDVSANTPTATVTMS